MKSQLKGIKRRLPFNLIELKVSGSCLGSLQTAEVTRFLSHHPLSQILLGITLSEISKSTQGLKDSQI